MGIRGMPPMQPMPLMLPSLPLLPLLPLLPPCTLPLCLSASLSSAALPLCPQYHLQPFYYFPCL